MILKPTLAAMLAGRYVIFSPLHAIGDPVEDVLVVGGGTWLSESSSSSLDE